MLTCQARRGMSGRAEVLCKAQMCCKARVSHKARCLTKLQCQKRRREPVWRTSTPRRAGSPDPEPGTTAHVTGSHLSHWAPGSGLAVHLGTAHGPAHLQLWPLHAEVGEGGGRPLKSIVQTPISAGRIGAPQSHQGLTGGHSFRHLGPVAGQPAAQPLSHDLGAAESPMPPTPP